MSQVAGGEAIFEEKCVFFHFFWQKKYKMWTKRGKMFKLYHIFNVQQKNLSIFSFSCQILNFGEIQDGSQDGRHI